jgi:2-methylcitrate dehydratase PrpD
MKKTFLTLAAVAALGFSGAAFAEEGNTGPAPMTDAEMGVVTAGGAIVTQGPPTQVQLPYQGSDSATSESHPGGADNAAIRTKQSAP